MSSKLFSMFPRRMAAADPETIDPRLPRPLHGRVSVLRPKQVTIDWHPPLTTLPGVPGEPIINYHLRIYKDTPNGDLIKLQEYVLTRTTETIYNLQPTQYYEIHIKSLQRIPNEDDVGKIVQWSEEDKKNWRFSDQYFPVKFCAAPTQRQDSEYDGRTPGPPLDGRMIKYGNKQIRDPRKHTHHVLLNWNSPRNFRGEIYYKIKWRGELLGVTASSFVDLGHRDEVRLKFQWMAQNQMNGLDPSINDIDFSLQSAMSNNGMVYNAQNQHRHGSAIPSEPQFVRRLKVYSQTLYKELSLESPIHCDITIHCPMEKKLENSSSLSPLNRANHLSPPNVSNNQRQRPQLESQSHSQSQPQPVIQYEDIFYHDIYLEQIIIWVYLEDQVHLPQLIIEEFSDVIDRRIEPHPIWSFQANGKNRTNATLSVAVWKKPFCRRLHSFFKIDIKAQRTNMNTSVSIVNVDNFVPQRNELMLMRTSTSIPCHHVLSVRKAFLVRAKQRACVVEYNSKDGVFQSVFGGQDHRREAVFRVMLQRMLQLLKNDDSIDDAKEDEVQPLYDDEAKQELLTFHDCHASIAWIMNGEWARIEERRETLKRVIHETFDSILTAKLLEIKQIGNPDNGDDDVHGEENRLYSDKVMKQLLLMLYWLIKLFLPNRFKYHWLTDTMAILVEYVRRRNQRDEQHQDGTQRLTVFRYLNRVYSAKLLWLGADGDNLMSYISAICQRRKDVLIGNFLPCVLWYNACYQCADSPQKQKILHQVHGGDGRDIRDMRERFKRLAPPLKHNEVAFKEMLYIQEDLEYEAHFGNICCVGLSYSYFKHVLLRDDIDRFYDAFHDYVYHVGTVKSKKSLAIFLKAHSQNIHTVIQSDFSKWKTYFRWIYDILGVNGHINEVDDDDDVDNNEMDLPVESAVSSPEQSPADVPADAVTVLNEVNEVIREALRPMFREITPISTLDAARTLYAILEEIPKTFDKTDIIKEVLLNKDDYLLLEHPEYFMDFIVNTLLIRKTDDDWNVKDENRMISHPLDGTLMIITKYTYFARLKIQCALQYWITGNVDGNQDGNQENNHYANHSMRIVTDIVVNHRIPWGIFADAVTSIVQNLNMTDDQEEDSINMSCFGQMLDHIADRNIPIEGRTAMVSDLVSFWREMSGIEDREKMIHKMFGVMMRLLFGDVHDAGNESEEELYDNIRREFQQIHPYRRFFSADSRPKRSVNSIFDDDAKADVLCDDDHAENEQNNTPNRPLTDYNGSVKGSVSKDSYKTRSDPGGVTGISTMSISTISRIRRSQNTMKNVETTAISEQMLRIPASICKLVLDQESFYRFGKALSDSSHWYRDMLLTSDSGLYYLMAILMMRLGEDTKCEHYFRQCITSLQSDGDTIATALRAVYRSDFALFYFSPFRRKPHKMERAKEEMEIACEQSNDGVYIGLVDSIVNGREEAIKNAIAYLDRKTNATASPLPPVDDQKSSDMEEETEGEVSNFSFFGRFLYAQWLMREGKGAESLKEYKVIMKQFGDRQGDGESMLVNGALYYQYAKVLMQQNRTDEAKEMFNAALQTMPCLPNINEKCTIKLKALDPMLDLNGYPFPVEEDHEMALLRENVSSDDVRNHQDESEQVEQDDDAQESQHSAAPLEKTTEST